MENFFTGARGGWKKFVENPVLGRDYGVCFDISVLKQDSGYRMYFSWRTKQSVAVTLSKDGFSWSEPQICVGPRKTKQGWEDEVNRPSVVYKDGAYHMWYTGQYKPGEADGTSQIFYAVSTDGIQFERFSDTPVLLPEKRWEKSAVMCPDVMWDEEESIFKMWYSAGEQYEPNAIGYAVSNDGIHWRRYEKNPIFQADPGNSWERHKAAACHVAKIKKEYIMFYIGYQNEDYAQIGIAKSKNGIEKWEKYIGNPIIAPSPGEWDEEACYKPYAIFDGSKWILWYNGRRGKVEQIGIATHEGFDLGL